MLRALELAGRGWGRVHPNPLVGAVLVQGSRVVGEGWHAEFGGPHAEVEAIRAAGDQARGATLFVTLEPCAHHGKTPPCTMAILEAGIRRVVFAARDPNAEAGGGGRYLRERGVAVESGRLEAEARFLNAAFHHVHENRTPFVALKLAMSLDQRLNEKPGEPSQITGAAARAEVHRLRAGFDAILTGRGTVDADDPQLTVRGDIVPRVPPVRIVLDTQARVRPDSILVRTARDVPAWVVCAHSADARRVAALRAAGVRVLHARPGPAGLDLADVLSVLWSDGVRTLICECGGRLTASLLQANVLHRLYLFIAPRMLGSAGMSAFPPDAPLAAWHARRARRIGEDALVILEPAARS